MRTKKEKTVRTLVKTILTIVALDLVLFFVLKFFGLIAPNNSKYSGVMSFIIGFLNSFGFMIIYFKYYENEIKRDEIRFVDDVLSRRNSVEVMPLDANKVKKGAKYYAVLNDYVPKNKVLILIKPENEKYEEEFERVYKLDFFSKYTIVNSR